MELKFGEFVLIIKQPVMLAMFAVIAALIGVDVPLFK